MDSSKFKNQLNTLQIIHYALIIGVLIFIGVVAYLLKSGAVEPVEPSFLNYVPYFAVIAAIPVAAFMHRANLEKIDRDQPLAQKMPKFQTAHIIRMAIYEGCSLIAIVLSLNLGQIESLIAPGVLIILMLLSTPTPSRIENQIGLTKEEKDQLLGS